MNTRNFQRDTQIEFGTRLFGEITSYNVQTVMIPGIDTTNIEIPNRGVMAELQGDQILFQDLSLTLLVDEDLNTWKDLMKHMFDHIQLPSGHFELNQANSWITIRDSAGKIMLNLVFHGSNITSVSGMSYDTTGEDTEITLDISIRYDYYSIEPTGYEF